MPGENVTFEAFGQNHHDKEALEAVRERLMSLHAKFKHDGRQLIIGIEHSDKDVKHDEESIRQKFNQGLMQTYLDEKRLQNQTASVDEFMTRHKGQLRWKSAEDATGFEELEMRERFKAQQRVADKDSERNKGPARMVEAEIYQWALDNKVPVRGLEVMSDTEKEEGLVGHRQINGDKMRGVEYERIQAMGGRTAALMKEIADGGGGCLVGLNMGPAHLGSLEVALRDELPKHGLDGAKVRMSVMVSSKTLQPNETAEGVMDTMLNTSVSDMRQARARLEYDVDRYEEALKNIQLVATQRETLASHVSDLPKDDKELRELMKTNPKRVADVLNKDISHKDAQIKEETITKISKALEGKPQTKAHEMLKEKLEARATDVREGIPQDQEFLDDARQELEKFLKTSPVLPFAQRVEERLKQKPEDVFQALTSRSEDGRYDLSVLDKGNRKTVREALGKNATSSTHAVQVQQEQGIENTDNSTRSKVPLGGSNNTVGTSSIKQ